LTHRRELVYLLSEAKEHSQSGVMKRASARDENSWERCNVQGGGLLDESLDFLNSSGTASDQDVGARSRAPVSWSASSAEPRSSAFVPLQKRPAEEQRQRKRQAEEPRQDERAQHVRPNYDSTIHHTDLLRSTYIAPETTSMHLSSRQLTSPSLQTLSSSCNAMDTGIFPGIMLSNTPMSVLGCAIAIPSCFSRLHMDEGILCNVPPLTPSSGHLVLHNLNFPNSNVGGGAASKRTLEEPRALSNSSLHLPFEHARGDEPDTKSRGAYKLLNASGTELHEAERVGIYPRRKVTDTHSPRIRNQAPLVVSLDSIKPLFDRPLSDAAKTLGISVTSLKAVCRRLGLERWYVVISVECLSCHFY